MADDVITDPQEPENEPVFVPRVVDDSVPVIDTTDPIVAEPPVADPPPADPEPTSMVVDPAPVQTVDIDDDKALEYLKTKGIEVASFEDLKPKEQKKLAAEAEKYQEYYEKTGRGIADFLETQKDWSQENPESVIKKQMALDNPDLDKEDVDFLYNKKFKFDEDVDDEDEIRSKKIEYKTELRKALNNLEAQKQEYMVSRGTEDIPAEYREAKQLVDQYKKEQQDNSVVMQQAREKFLADTESVFTPNFEGFKVKIGDEEMAIKPANIQETKEFQSVFSNFEKKYLDERGVPKDPVAYHKALYFAMDPDGAAKHFFELGQAKVAEIEDRLSKNLPLPGQQTPPPVEGGWRPRIVPS